MKELMIFEGVELEVLTKEDVSINFDGEVLFNAKQTCDILGYSNSRKAIADHVREKHKVKITNSDVTNRYFRKLNNAGETFITEKGVMKLIISSNMPKADEFEDKVWEIISEVQSTGRYDSIEQKIKAIEDETERRLTLSLYQAQKVLENDPNNFTNIFFHNNAKHELDSYLQKRQLETVRDEVKAIEEKINKATVLREGDMSAEAIAKKFNIFSTSNKPHNRFADNLARDLGFYISPEGNSGYQDEYVSITLTSRGGVTMPVVKYSKKAFEEMERYIEGGNLNFITPPTLYTRKPKAGQFKEGILEFESGAKIKVNELTYNLYVNMTEE